MKMVRLGDVCTVVTGSTPKTSVDEYWNGAVDWITPAELTDDTYIINESQRKITSLAVEKTGLKPFPKDTVILSSRAPIGKVAIAGKEMYCNQGFKNLICSSEINSRYLYWYLKSKTEYLNSLGRGATFKELSKSIVENILIPLPSLEIQEKQVMILEKCSSIIKIYRKQIHDCKILSQSRFVEMFGDTITNPLGWEEHRLDEYIEFLTSGSRGWSKYFVDKENELFITIKNVKNNRIILDTIQYINAPDNKEAERTKVKEGDLLISITADLGRTGVVDNNIAEKGAYINQHLSLVRLDRDKINPLYVSYFLETEGGKMQFESKNQNGVKAGLNFEAIKSLKILVPPLKMQEAYLTFVAQTDKLKATIQKSIDEAQTLFDSLMQEYFG